MKQLQTISIVAPGFFGLNTQESGVTLSSNYAQLTDNVVIDKYGRLGARKGWLMKTTSGASELDGNPIRFMLDNINADGSTTLLSAGNNKVFTGGNGEALTDVTPALYTITDNDWSGASILETGLLVQEGHEPLVYDITATPVMQPMVYYMSAADGSVADYASLPGSPTTGDRYHVVDTNTVYEWDGSAWNDVTVVQNYGTAYPKHAIAAYGRFWTHNGSTVYWSTDIADPDFPCFCGGTSGSLNIASVLPRNVDEIVSLAVHNDFLVIFCKHNIVLYSGASNPIGVNFALADIIAGVGCVAKNSVQPTGNDLIFLSDTGVRSLGRLLSEKSLPMRDLTKNIRDDFLKDMNAEIANNLAIDPSDKDPLNHVCSVYSEQYAFYLISFPSTETVYVLDMRMPLEDGSARCTVWYQYEAHAFLRLADRTVLIGKPDGIGEYTGYTDNGTKYRLRYFSHYLDLGSNVTKKMLKQIKMTVLGGSNQQITVKVGSDYTASYFSYAFTVDNGTSYEYGSAKYPEYSEFKGVVDNYASLPASPSTNDAYYTLDNQSVYQWNGTSWLDLSRATSSVSTFAALPSNPSVKQRVRVRDENDDIGVVYEWDGSAWNVVVSWEDVFTLVSNSEYVGGVVIDTIKSSVSGSGNVIQIGFEADVNGSELSVQALDCFVKTGRIS